jgi:hypothetical protein
MLQRHLQERLVLQVGGRNVPRSNGMLQRDVRNKRQMLRRLVHLLYPAVGLLQRCLQHVHLPMIGRALRLQLKIFPKS